MNLFYEITILGAKLSMVGLGLTTTWALCTVLHDRYVKGNVDAFKPERRVGPTDRRAGLTGY